MAIAITQCLHRAKQQNPNRLATVSGDRRQTYSAFIERVERLAGALRGLGVDRRDRVAILALNSDRYIEAYCAIFWLGAAVNPANTRWSAKEIAYSFNDCETTVMFVDDAFTPMVKSIRAETPGLRDVIFMDDLGRDRSDIELNALNYEDLIATANPVPDVCANGDDLAGVFYTGGTTGFPKGVMLSHESLMGSVVNRMGLGIPVGPVYLHAPPLFHLAGAMGMFWQLFASGTHIALPSFSSKSFLELAQREAVTDTLLVPTMIQMVLDDPEFSNYDLSALRFLVYGASPIDETLLNRTMAAMPKLALMQGYGMTELSGCVTYLEPFYHTPEGRQQKKLRSAGRAAPMAELKIVDDSGQEVPRGTVGEIAARGMSNMIGYWNRETETQNTLRDGWVHSGDGAYMDDDGFIFIVDRMKDMIVSGGENVYSAEVENAVLKHDAVAMCAVIGIPNQKWGESVHAIVVLKPDQQLDQEALIAHCKDLIGGYKCPRSVEFRTELPLSGAGKVQKNELRAPYWAGKGRSVS